MITGSVSESSPSTEVLLQLHSAILEAVTAIVHFLSGLQASRDRSQLLIADVHPVVVATVRVLGAWLAEESLELSTEVYGLLPFLLLLCDPSPRDRGCPVQDGLIKFILPGLCHLTADDVPRAILMKAQLPYTITKYLQHLWGERYVCMYILHIHTKLRPRIHNYVRFVLKAAIAFVHIHVYKRCENGDENGVLFSVLS